MSHGASRSGRPPGRGPVPGPSETEGGKEGTGAARGAASGATGAAISGAVGGAGGRVRPRDRPPRYWAPAPVPPRPLARAVSPGDMVAAKIMARQDRPALPRPVRSAISSSTAARSSAPSARTLPVDRRFQRAQKTEGDYLPGEPRALRGLGGLLDPGENAGKSSLCFNWGNML
jgi:hypothetical protein